MIFLDAEKAFDCLNWTFMLKVLEDMDFGENFMSGINRCIHHKKHIFIVNHELTKPHEIQKGARLSHLYFLFSLRSFV